MKSQNGQTFGRANSNHQEIEYQNMLEDNQIIENELTQTASNKLNIPLGLKKSAGGQEQTNQSDKNLKVRELAFKSKSLQDNKDYIEEDFQDDEQIVETNIYNLRDIKIIKIEQKKNTTIAGFVQSKLIKPMNRVNRFIYNLQGKVIDSYMMPNQLKLINDFAFIGKNIESRKRKMLFFKLKKLDKTISKKYKNANEKEIDQRFLFLRKKSFQFRNIIKERVISAGELIQNSFPIFQPDSAIRITMDLISTIFILYFLIMIPLRLSFDFEIPEYLEIAQLIMDIFFLIDTLCMFNTAYYEKGNLIQSRRLIFFNYLKFWFWIDFITALPYDLIVPEGNTQTELAFKSTKILKILRILRFIKALKLLRVVKLTQIFQKFEEYIQLSDTISGLLGFFKIVVLVLSIAHYFACILNFISEIDYQQYGESWFSRFGLDPNQQDRRYLAAVYWAVTTMMTIGYGDIVPVTHDEKIFTIFTIILASVIFAYITTNIGSVLKQFERGQQIYKEKMVAANNYMKRKHLNKNLRIKINKYLEYLWNYDIDLLEEENLLGCLSQSLREQVQIEVNLKFLQACSVLRSKFSENFIRDVAVFVKEKIYLPEEIIFQEEDQEDKNLYYVSGGCITIYMKSTFTNLKDLEEGQCFGELGFFTGAPRTASAKSKIFSSVAQIQRDIFLEILNRHSADKEMFHYIKDKLIYYKDYSFIDMECYICNENSHLSQNCPKVHYVVERQTFINYFLQCQYNFLKIFERRPKKRSNTLKSSDNTRNCFFDIQNDIKKILESGDIYQLDQEYFDMKLVKKYLLIEQVNKNQEDQVSNLEEYLPIQQKKKTLIELNKFTEENIHQLDFIHQRKSSVKTNNGSIRSYSVRLIAMKVVVDIKENKAENLQTRREQNIANAMSVWECDMDRYYNFQVYFPHNNINKVIKENQVQLQKETVEQPKLTKKQTIFLELKNLLLPQIQENNQKNKKYNPGGFFLRAIKSLEFSRSTNHFPEGSQIQDSNQFDETKEKQQQIEFSTGQKDFKFNKESRRLRSAANIIMEMRRKNQSKASYIINDLSSDSDNIGSEDERDLKTIDLHKILFQGLIKGETIKDMQQEEGSSDKKEPMINNDQISEQEEQEEDDDRHDQLQIITNKNQFFIKKITQEVSQKIKQ